MPFVTLFGGILGYVSFLRWLDGDVGVSLDGLGLVEDLGRGFHFGCVEWV